MTSRAIDPGRDPARTDSAPSVRIEFDGREYKGVRGQTVAGILLANGIREWRTTSITAQPRGMFCGIGVCFDCLVTIDGRRDMRACLCRPEGGETVTRQHDLLPHHDGDEG